MDKISTFIEGSVSDQDLKVHTMPTDIPKEPQQMIDPHSISQAEYTLAAHRPNNQQPPTTSKPSPQICFDFTKNQCSRGASCKYSHDLETIIAVNSQEKGICFDFLKGACNRGPLCRFSHDFSYIQRNISTAQPPENAGSRRSFAPICYDFVKNQCTRGEECRYSHDYTSILTGPRPVGKSPWITCMDYLRGRCNRGAACRYSHADPRTNATRATAMLHAGGSCNTSHMTHPAMMAAMLASNPQQQPHMDYGRVFYNAHGQGFEGVSPLNPDIVPLQHQFQGLGFSGATNISQPPSPTFLNDAEQKQQSHGMAFTSALSMLLAQQQQQQQSSHSVTHQRQYQQVPYQTRVLSQRMVETLGLDTKAKSMKDPGAVAYGSSEGHSTARRLEDSLPCPGGGHGGTDSPTIRASWGGPSNASTASARITAGANTVGPSRLGMTQLTPGAASPIADPVTSIGLKHSLSTLGRELLQQQHQQTDLASSYEAVKNIWSRP